MPADLALGTLPRLAPGASVWLGYSGGLDSTVLLHLLAASSLPVKAVHVNHQLQAFAGRWAEHCREACAKLKVPIYVVDVRIEPGDAEGPEGAARRERYAAFRSLMKAGDWLATAHHQDDQAETVLLRLMRGSGPTGLAAMRKCTDFTPGSIWRPLLQRSRAQLRSYAERHEMQWIEDPHNLDPRFSRTFVRHELFPRLQQRWPQAIEMLARSAALSAEAVELLDELAAGDLQAVQLAADPAAGAGLSVRKLLALPGARRSNALRAWAAQLGLEAPPFDALQRLEREVLRARPDASPVLAWGEAELRRYRDRLYLMTRLAPAPGGAVLEWSGLGSLELPEGCGRITVTRSATSELALRVRFARGGERIKPAGARFTRTLRNLFQEEAVPGWIRERVPLIEHQGELGAIGDRWMSAPFAAMSKRSRLQFSWQHVLAGCPEKK